MKNIINLLKVLMLSTILLSFVACSQKIVANGVSQIDMRLYVDGNSLDVEWENNESVEKLKELANINDLTINTHRYGGFEQVGEIGQSIVSNNIQMTTEPGDIVLYNSSNLVVFFGNNSWSYTNLGKIKNKTLSELKQLLDKESVTFVIKTDKESTSAK